MAKNEHLLFDYSIIREKWNQIEYEIYSYNKDGSFDDYWSIVVLSIYDSIKDYIRENCGTLLCEYKG